MTPEEIKRGLKCCIDGDCDSCPYYEAKKDCGDRLKIDALAYIRQLEAAHRTEYCEEADYDCIALGNARKRVTELEAAQPKWISVEERLPKRNERVVVTDGKHTWDYGEFSGLAFGDGNPRNWEWKKHTIRHVEWWMPKNSALPEPPKEGACE